MSAVATEAPGPEGLAAEQFSQLYGLFMLSMMMFDGRSEEAIIRLACTAAPQLGSCRVEAGYLARDGVLEWVPGGAREPRPQLHAAVAALRGAEGAVELAGWAWAYPLGSLGAQRGYLVVGAPVVPSRDEQFMLRVLAQQTGAALSNAVLHRTEREQAGQLQVLNAELAEANEQLGRSLSALQRQRRIHEVLSRVPAAGAGEAGVARALHRLTGFAVAVEDRFGNLRAWAGPGRPDPYAKPSERRRSQVLARAVRDCRPVRDRDRLVALARPRHEVLGVLALIDPDHAAGEHEVFALEHGAVLLAAELAHQRSLTEVELRMRRDLVDDLLGGAADASVFPRAEALGHDLHRPHRVVVVQWHGPAAARGLVRAVARAVAELQLDCLMADQTDSVVLLAHHGTDRNGPRWWDEMYRFVARELRCTEGAVGVGGRAETAADLRRSHEQARRALSIRQGSLTRTGVAVFDELGVYRILAAGENAREMQTFVREWLGLLLDYDRGHRSALVHTLSTYLECGGNYDETAQALRIHRSTLRYRLQRIREISGLDLGKVDNRFNLHVATRAWRVLDGSA